MLNSVVLIGRLTKDPELRYIPSGKAVATLRLAVDRGTTNAQGEKETDFIDVVVWEKQAETVANYLQKGRLVALTGRLQIRQYETQDGQRREKAEVVANQVRFLDKAPDSGQNLLNDGGKFKSSGSKGADTNFNDEGADVPF